MRTRYNLVPTSYRDVFILTWILALAALIILLRFKINSIWLILAGAIVGITYFQLR